jgi:AbrB family transcriptional regulator (stage V sporulation protein T)
MEENILKATGIVRRIDDLGRIVIPKEIRRTLRIRETDPLEIFTDKEGEIILKKYSPIGELGAFAKEYADSLAETTGHTVCVSDRDTIIAAAGPDKKSMIKKNISKNLEGLLEERKSLLAISSDSDFVPVTDDLKEEYMAEALSPIVCEGDVLGAVIIMSRESKMHFTETELKLALSAAVFLGKQLGQSY